jgi:hypothetical protein
MVCRLKLRDWVLEGNLTDLVDILLDNNGITTFFETNLIVSDGNINQNKTQCIHYENKPTRPQE